MGLIDRIKQLSEKKGVTRYDIARATGISEASLSRIWNEQTSKPQQKTVKILAEYFNVNLNWLLTGEGEMLNTGADKDDHPPITRPETSHVESFTEIIKGFQQTQALMFEEMQQLKKEIQQTREEAQKARLEKDYYVKLYTNLLEELGKETEKSDRRSDEASVQSF